jgi:branched-chain amino acid transport system ATP-binding protein
MSNSSTINQSNGDTQALLSAKNLAMYYRDLQVLFNVTIEVPKGACVAVLGANGAGKSSLLRSIAGLAPLRGGSVTFDGKDCAGLKAHQRARRGLVLVPDERAIFGTMSVMENLKLGAYSVKDRRQIEESTQWAFSIFPILARRSSQLAGSLSGGEQKMLALAKALMAKPTLLMLDEPSAGLAPVMVDTLYDALGQVRKTSDLAVLLVEQNIYAALDLATYGYVIQNGRVVFGGPRSDIPEVDVFRKAYLGI